MKVLVMGGSLFNGRSLVQALVEAGHDVTVSNRGRTPTVLPDGVDLLVADRTDHDQVRSVLGGTEWDAVVDMSAYHPEDTRLMCDVLADSCGHYVFISSTVTYASPPDGEVIDESFPDDRGPDQNEYGLHKIFCEEQLFGAYEATGFPATTVPLSMVFGPHNALPGREQRMFTRMLAGRPVLVPGDGSTRGIVGHVDDQSRAIEAILGVEASFGRRFNLTGDDPHTDTRYVDVFSAVTGTSCETVSIPAELMDQLWDGEVSVSRPGGSRTTMDIRPTEAAVERVIPHAHKFALANIIQRLQPNVHRWDTDVVFSVDALKEVTGWAPKFTFDQAVEQTYDWWRNSEYPDTVEQDFGFEDEILAMIRP